MQNNPLARAQSGLPFLAMIGLVIAASPRLQAQAPDGDLSVAGVALSTDSLTFVFNESDDTYSASGTTSIQFLDQSLELTVPSDGLVVTKQNDDWTLESLSAEVQADIELYGLALTVDEDDPLTFAYTPTERSFSVYGAVSLNIEDQGVTGFLGTPSTPGLVITDGQLESYEIGISEDISLSGLEIATTGDFLGMAYDATSSTYAIFGGLAVTFDSESISVNAGDSENPGVVLTVDTSKQIQLTSLNATVTEDITLFGLELATGDDGLTFQFNADGPSYEVYGELDLTIEGQVLDGILGDADNPGLNIQNGTVESLNIGVASDFDIGGFEFHSPNDNPFTVTYDHASDTYTLSGTAELDSLWDTSIELGTADHPGIVISNNRWMIDDLTIEIDSLDLGFAQLKELKVSYSRTDDDDLDVEIVLDVSIPELEIEVAGDVRVDNGKISSIYTDFKASGTSEGLEILDTGIDIAEMSVSLENLDQPASLILSGMIGLEFGGQLSIAGQTVTLAYIEGDVYIDADELRLSDSVFYGAYENDNGDWTSVIFKGEATLDLNWSQGVYSIDGDIQLPTDYGVKISESLRFTSEQIVMQAEADVRVPNGIPIIGGDNLGSIDADLLIDMKDSTKSFAAGWITIDLLFTDECAGIKYTFHNGDIDYIGSGEISDIKKEIKDAESSNSTITKHFTVDVPDGATSFVMDFDWFYTPIPNLPQPVELGIPQVIVSATGNVFKADGSVAQSALSLHDLNYDQATGFLALADDLIDVVEASTGVTFSCEGLALTAGITGQELAFLALAPGEVTVSVTYDRSIDPLVTIDTPTLSFYFDYPDPTISLDQLSTDETNSSTDGGVTTLLSGTSLPIQLSYFTDPAFAVDAGVTVYLDKNARGHNGHAIIGPIHYTNTSISDATTETHTWTIENVYGDADGDYYFYAGIDNGNQPIVYTDYVGPFRIDPAIKGTVFEATQLAPLSGFRVYLDTNGNNRYDSGSDPTTITDNKGAYTFDDIAEGEVTVGVVIPKGFVPNEKKQDLVKRNYVNGDTVTVDFNVLQLTTISGVVFTDTNENGTQDAGEVGLFGVTLYLDENGDGIFTPGVDTSTMSDIEGKWSFNGVEPDTVYQVTVLGFNTQLTNEITTFSVSTSSKNQNGIARLVKHNVIQREFGGHQIPVLTHAVEEITRKRYMVFAKSFFDGTGDIHVLGADPDNDGLTNQHEHLLGSKPTEFNDGNTIDIVPSGEDGFELIIGQVDQHRYLVETSSDLVRWVETHRFRATDNQPTLIRFGASAPSTPTFVRVRIED